jgi:hypothetical protein
VPRAAQTHDHCAAITQRSANHIITIQLRLLYSYMVYNCDDIDVNMHYYFWSIAFN